MTKEDIILQQVNKAIDKIDVLSQDVAVLNHVTASIDELRSDMAVMKDKHNVGNRSERLMVGISVFALLVSICVAVASCKDCFNEKNDNRRPPANLRILRGK